MGKLRTAYALKPDHISMCIANDKKARRNVRGPEAGMAGNKARSSHAQTCSAYAPHTRSPSSAVANLRIVFHPRPYCKLERILVINPVARI